MSSSILTTIVIPAYKEAANLKELVTRIYNAMGERGKKSASLGMSRERTEVIVVDDNSKDGSEEIINDLAKDSTNFPNLRIIVRTNEKGLSSAVLRGFNEAKGDYLMCMDADLQHPPEDVPIMFEYLLKEGTQVPEFVLGTRYGSGEMRVDSNWPLYRRVISKGARSLARPLTPLSDPMSGFFALPKTVYQRAIQNKVNPIGFKIALELFVKAGVKRHAEHAFAFGVRLHGYSKLSSKVIIHYLQHLYDLYQYRYPFMLHLVALFLILLAIFVFSRLFSKK
ncbi:hypothetical protein C9374_003238 [Naegleria lovaniensis]|uniref:Dolichol-phosphate mannosyltransferase subunit 1 n=1 Tax=Naegleria lovaniensis TaxID=51637 RepID=A0AA88GSV5_NAELO|nr:uncharacterized protein C9374_014228 [Naegleria lovaniensis]XP_044549416.1 uncharacterized protein C9374_003238 [Naegleria lovaniensis]KAG2370770.1 hypothetical protein C9374_014228 [Naegleria lovaniensis]KAG2385423.1 hypothetical protein C9374_003238 [Naegleria lovaniensis]